MSKMDQLRALREAKYAHAVTHVPVRPTVTPAVLTVPAATGAAPAEPEPPAPDAGEPVDPAEQLCGHRSMNGRTCTREHGHAARSHRYS